MKLVLFLILLLSADALNAYDQQRAQYLYSIVKCTTCKGQAIKDSNSQIAQILKSNINSQIEQGKTDSEILDLLRAKYGDEISYKPKFTGYVLPLFIVPVFVILVGLYVINKNRA